MYTVFKKTNNKEVKRFVYKIKNFYNFWNSKGAREISASFTYYFVIGFIPALTLFLSLLNESIPEEILLSPLLPSAVSGMLSIVEHGGKAGVGGSVFVLAIALYSSVNLFYRFKKCGELLYGKRSSHTGIIKGVLSFVILALTVSLFFIALAVYFALTSVVKGAMLVVLLNVGIIAVSFAVVLIMNFLICPYKIGFKDIIRGAVVTLFCWVVVSLVYTLYLTFFANYERIYGMLGVFVSFTIYAYFVMQIFTVGVVWNIYFKTMK